MSLANHVSQQKVQKWFGVEAQSEMVSRCFRSRRIAGIFVLIIGIGLVIGSIIACVCMFRKAKEYQQQRSQVSTVVAEARGVVHNERYLLLRCL